MPVALWCFVIVCRFKKELKKRKVPLSDYVAQPDFEWKGETREGLKVFDNEVGTGKGLNKGNTAVVSAGLKPTALFCVRYAHHSLEVPPVTAYLLLGNNVRYNYDHY